MSSPRDITPPNAERLSSLLCALAEIAVAALLVRVIGAFELEHGLAKDLLVYGGTGFTLLNPGEARLFVAYGVAGLPAALILVDAATRLLGGRPAPWSARVLAHPRIMAVVFALATAIAVEAITSFVLGRAPISDDERVYVFQARQLLAGHFTSLRPPFGQGVFNFEMVLPVGSQQWAGAYPPGQPFFIALGMLLHAPHVMQTLCAAGIVYTAARFADEVWGAESSVAAGALTASSPLLLFNAASLHNAVPAAFFLLLATRSAWRALVHGRRRDFAVVGVGLSAALLFRPYDAAAVGLPIAVALLFAALRRAPRGAHVVGTSGLALSVAAGLPCVLVLLAANHAVTGHPLEPAYSAWLQWRFPGARVLGFGPTAFPDPSVPVHTPEVMLSKGLVVVCRLSTWLFGWPVSLWPLLAMLLGIGRDRCSRFLLAILGTHFLAYAAYTLNPIQEMGSPYHVAELPVIALLSARAITALGGRLSTFGEWLSLWPGRLALTCGLVSVLTFWPIETQWLRGSAQSVRQPLELAENAAAGKPALMFWRYMEPVTQFRNWAFHPPLPGPKLDDSILWVADTEKNATVMAAYPDRKAFRLDWDSDGHPYVVPMSPK